MTAKSSSTNPCRIVGLNNKKADKLNNQKSRRCICLEVSTSGVVAATLWDNCVGEEVFFFDIAC